MAAEVLQLSGHLRIIDGIPARPPPRGIGGLFHCGGTIETKRVVLFVDYENMHRCAVHAFNLTNGHFWPWQPGELLVNRRNTRVPNVPCLLSQVRVYRGLPDSRRQPKANAANQAQTAAWEKSAITPAGIAIFRRPLKYPMDWPKGNGNPQEKGVDVALAVDLVQMTYQDAFDVGIVCSHDTDLSPALDAVARASTSRVHLEVASWSPMKRISYSGQPGKPWCHHLNKQDFDAVRDPSSYP